MKCFPLTAFLAAAALIVPAAASESAASAPAPAPVASGNDHIERLYQRLSDKLGSVRQPTDDGSILLRVPSRPLPHGSPPARRVAMAKKPAPAVEASHPGHAAWSYEGAGAPQQWGSLQPEFAKCSSGTRQSPIDLHDGFRVQLAPIEFNYQPSGFRVIDNGHTVQASLAPVNALNVLGRRYLLKQFHFHRPSETRINGRAFEMEAHLVHQDDEGRLAVVAVLFERGAAANPAVQQVWNNLPLEKGEEQAAQEPLDPARLLPDDRRYYTYMGSLTTPPCSEGVMWMVLKQPMPVAAQQIELFARLYPMNARPVQAAAGRVVKESE